MNGKPVILLLETEAVVRHPLAEYLRHCGYAVIEATDTNEAMAFLQSGEITIEAALLDVRAKGAQDVFVLAGWIRSNCSADVIMVGAVEAAAQKAAELCEAGPKLSRPYEPSAVVDLIKRLRAERNRNGE